MLANCYKYNVKTFYTAPTAIRDCSASETNSSMNIREVLSRFWVLLENPSIQKLGDGILRWLVMDDVQLLILVGKQRLVDT